MVYIPLLVFFVSLVRVISNSPAHFNNLQNQMHMKAHRPLTNETRYSEAQNFVFEDDYRLESKPKLFAIEGNPECAEGKTFCKQMPNYPYQYVDTILRKANVKLEIFKLVDSFFDVRKLNDEDEDNFVCKSVREVIRPESAKNSKDQWKYIINQKGNGVVQELEIETCQSSKSACGLYPPSGYTTECKQKYLFRRLLSFSEEGQPVVDLFSFPSACGCVYNMKRKYTQSFNKKQNYYQPGFPNFYNRN